jgi:serine/threonine protein kinase
MNIAAGAERHHNVARLSDEDPTMTTGLREDEQTAPYRPAGSFVPPSPQELTACLPNLEVTEILGHGGMGVVYKGRQPLLDRQVAIKLIRPDFGDDEEAQRGFIREAQALARLTHPYVVSVFDCGKAGDLYYFVMEYVAGTSLRHRLAEKALTERDVLDFLPQVGEALRHAHENGIVHRDVKPENILVDARNRVRLVDFGLAKWLVPSGQPNSDENRVAGTWGYMAPEQFSAPESVDHRADIYSTGVVCYEMLTGTLPRGERQPPSASSAADPRFDPIVARALEPDRERRYQQMRDMNVDVVRLTQTPDSTIRLSKSIPASIERVFAAWTDPASMVDWYAPTDDFTTPIAEVDLKVGGAYRVGMKPKDVADPSVVSGQYCRIEPPSLLSFTWAWEAPHPDVQETQVTLKFRPDGGSTELVLTHERFRDEELRKRHTEGWTGCLSRLARKISS